MLKKLIIPFSAVLLAAAGVAAVAQVSGGVSSGNSVFTIQQNDTLLGSTTITTSDVASATNIGSAAAGLRYYTNSGSTPGSYLRVGVAGYNTVTFQSQGGALNCTMRPEISYDASTWYLAEAFPAGSMDPIDSWIHPYESVRMSTAGAKWAQVRCVLGSGHTIPIQAWGSQRVTPPASKPFRNYIGQDGGYGNRVLVNAQSRPTHIYSLNAHVNTTGFVIVYDGFGVPGNGSMLSNVKRCYPLTAGQAIAVEFQPPIETIQGAVVLFSTGADCANFVSAGGMYATVGYRL